MALVDYSESEASDSDCERPATRPVHKKRVIDHRGKIIVNLPPPSSSSSSSSRDHQQQQPSSSSSSSSSLPPPPEKGTRTSAAGLFSGFNSFLPPPKKTAAQPRSGSAVVLKTSVEPGFDRGNDASTPAIFSEASAWTATQEHEGKKPSQAEPVGKPTMFKPLSVARGTNKKKASAAASIVKPTKDSMPPPPAPSAAQTRKKQPLFSLHADEEASEPTTAASADEYSTAPVFDTGPASDDDARATPVQAHHHRLDTIADDLNLTAAARRELFGRHASVTAAQPVLDFNMDHEYQHNEQIRAAGDQQIHNPVRAIQGGKHNLRQLVHNVQSQREALEDSFAQGKSNRKDASSRYGWR
ncbi:hypothetical protein XA68_10532 [Ophiocordyceps unilateralis]|uniref:Uncharacterized protein n=1 Tax=Ophiocordyceps unilateralis TaxID=268505 RepID=A0A2A9PHK2_OPHUN|nr:hypothetical protein XA68_10532 [Ophiocordyceps unilateralis]